MKVEEIDFGKKLISIRKTSGLTQEEVAEKCNVTTRTIQRIESGAVTPRNSTIKIISEGLKIDFFKTLNEIPKKENHSVLWHLKDLFNLKTNPMKKVSILTTSILIIVFTYIGMSDLKAQSNTPENKQNEIVSTAQNYVILGNFDEIRKGWALVTNKDKYGFINTKGKIVVPIEYDLVSMFGEVRKDWALVMKNNKYGFINTNGEIVVPIDYDLVSMFGEVRKDWALVMKNNKYGFIGTNGKIVVPIEYDLVSMFGEVKSDWALVMKNNKYGFIGTNGKIVVPIEYDLVSMFGEIAKDLALVMKNNKYGLMNMEGKIVVPCKYETIKVKGSIAFATNKGKTTSIKI